MIVILDAGPTGVLSNPSGNSNAVHCQIWLSRLLTSHIRVYVSEIADYEIRRELIRAERFQSLSRLNDLAIAIPFLAITTPTMRRAAELWARARQRGTPTADKAALDADVILAAQAQLLHEATGDRVIVASDNIRHLQQFVETRRWQDLQP